MANNRMWLVHAPTGLAVFLGKRMGWGWYTMKESDTHAKLQCLYDTLEDQGYAGNQDDFVLAMESVAGGASSRVCGDWSYSGIERSDGLTQMVLTR